MFKSPISGAFSTKAGARKQCNVHLQLVLPAWANVKQRLDISDEVLAFTLPLQIWLYHRRLGKANKHLLTQFPQCSGVNDSSHILQ